MAEFDVSALVVSYNSDYKKLLITIKSLLLQKGVLLQIVIADDGSSKDYFIELESYFREVGYCNYVLVKNVFNQGIVKNFMSGLKKCEGTYVKPISPGDYLFGESVLREWTTYMKNNDITVCGAKYACYYYNSDGQMAVSKQRLHPQSTNLKGRKLRVDYIIYDDIFLGAATLCRAEVLIKYVSMLTNKVKYAEDNCYRIMAYCGENMGFYNKGVLLYEMGTGISTGGNEEWSKRIKKDWQATDQIILKIKNGDEEMKKLFRKSLAVKNNARGGARRYLKYLKIRGWALSMLKAKIMPKFSVGELPRDWIKRIGGDFA